MLYDRRLSQSSDSVVLTKMQVAEELLRVDMHAGFSRGQRMPKRPVPRPTFVFRSHHGMRLRICMLGNALTYFQTPYVKHSTAEKGNVAANATPCLQCHARARQQHVRGY